MRNLYHTFTTWLKWTSYLIGIQDKISRVQVFSAIHENQSTPISILKTMIFPENMRTGSANRL